MDTPSVAEFFKRVVAWPGEEPGYINVHAKSPRYTKGMIGRPYRTLVDFMNGVDWYARHPTSATDIYFCLSTQRDVGKVYNGHAVALRRRDNTSAIKCIILDVDVKAPPKGYLNVVEALQAIAKFVVDAGLPLPTALVNSGGGIHVYWISDRELSPAEWAPYAEGLRDLADHHGLRFDAACTIDLVRVLRVPDTFNHKEATPRPVKLLSLAPTDYNFETALGHIRSNAHSATAGTAAPAEVGRVSSRPVTFLLAKRAQRDPRLDTAAYKAEIGNVGIGLLDPRICIAQCPFLKDTLRTGGKSHDQGLWMQVGLATTFFENGNHVFHQLSKGHPDYDAATVDAMYERKDREREEKDMGWPKCQTFERYGSKLCAGCPHKGKIQSPLNLTLPAATPKPDQASAFATMDGPAARELFLPKGFFIDPHTGYIATSEEQRSTGGATYPVTVTLFKCFITNPWIQNNNDLHFTTSLDVGNTGPVVINNDQITTVAALVLAMRKQGCNPNPEGEKHLRNFMTSWIEDLRRKKAREALTHGWWKDNGKDAGFAYGGVIRTNEGKTLTAAPGSAHTRQHYLPKGSIDVWFRALKLITDQHRPALEAIVAASFASPLLHWTGQYAVALVAHSRTGANKSTAVNLGGAVWANPKLTKEVASASSNSIRVKMAELNNLPAYWDDVSETPDVEKAGATIKDLTQGKDGGKLNQDRSQKAIGSWQSLLIICSNVSMFDYYVRTNKSNAAGVYRIFEFSVPPAALDTPGRIDGREATMLQQLLEENYGRMGELYTERLLSNPTLMEETVKSVYEQLKEKVGEADGERFWLAIVSTILAGAHMANSLGATFNLGELELFLIKSYNEMRARVEEESLNGNDFLSTSKVLTEFIKANSGNTLHTKDRIGGKGGTTKKVVTILGMPDTTREINIQWVVGERLLRMSRGKFTKFLTDNDYSPVMVMDGLKMHFNAQWGEAHRASLTAGTPFRGGQERLIDIPVPEKSELEQEMFAHSPEAIRSGPGLAAPGTQATGLPLPE